MKVRVLWALRGRTVVEIPDGTPEEEWQDAIEEPIGNDFTTDQFQWDSDGYEIYGIDEDWEGVAIHPDLVKP